MKKMFSILSLFVMSSAMLYAESGASQALNKEIIGISKSFGLALFLFIMLAYIAVPIGAIFFGKGIAKKKAEQNQEEAGGITTMVWALGSGIAGFFVVFVVVGFLGSMMQGTSNSSNGANGAVVQGSDGIDLVAGNKHIISKTLGSLLNNTENDLSGSSSAGGGS